MKIVRTTAVVDAGWLIQRLINCRVAFCEESAKANGDVYSGLDFLRKGIVLRKSLSTTLLENLTYQQRIDLLKQIDEMNQCYEVTFETILYSDFEKVLFESIKMRKSRHDSSYNEIISIFTETISRCKGMVANNEVGYDLMYLGYNLPLVMIKTLEAVTKKEITTDTAFQELCKGERILRFWRRRYFVDI